MKPCQEQPSAAHLQDLLDTAQLFLTRKDVTISKLEGEVETLTKAADYALDLLTRIKHLHGLAQGGEQEGNWLHVVEGVAVLEKALKNSNPVKPKK